MRVVVICRSVGEGGVGGYGSGLIAGLRSRGHMVRVWPGSGRRPGAMELALGARHVASAGEVAIALERTLGHAVYRAGAGVHRVYRRAMGRRPSPLEWLDRRAVLGARVVVANSEATAHDLVAELGVSSAKVELVRTGVDLERFHPRDRQGRSGRVVLFAAHGWRRKGFETAVNAFCAVASGTDTLWIAGRDSRRRRWMRWARRKVPDLEDLGLSVDLSRVLPQVDCLLHPTRYDPASNVVLEAMACGVPPVTTQMDGSAEVLPEPRLIVQEPQNVRQVVSALRFALHAPEGLVDVLRASAACWPDTRNVAAMEAIVSRCGNG